MSNMYKYAHVTCEVCKKPFPGDSNAKYDVALARINSQGWQIKNSFGHVAIRCPECRTPPPHALLKVRNGKTIYEWGEIWGVSQKTILSWVWNGWNPNSKNAPISRKV